MADLLFRYASQNYARFTFDGRCKELADFMTGTLMSQDVDALLPLQAPPISQDSMISSTYADALQCLSIPQVDSSLPSTSPVIGLGGVRDFSFEDS